MMRCEMTEEEGGARDKRGKGEMAEEKGKQCADR